MSTTTTTPELIQRLGERLNEEKWTRTALGPYTVANCEELDAIVREIHEADLENEAHDACTNHLEQSKDSIGARYISGLLDVSRQLVNDGNLIIDTHDQDVIDPVWALYEETAKRLGPVSTMIERDGNRPELDVVLAELDRAREIAAPYYQI